MGGLTNFLQLHAVRLYPLPGTRKSYLLVTYVDRIPLRLGAIKYLVARRVGSQQSALASMQVSWELAVPP